MVGSAKIRNAASAVPEIPLYKKPVPSNYSGRILLASWRPGEYLAETTAS
jgi:hypothetical protein